GARQASARFDMHFVEAVGANPAHHLGEIDTAIALRYADHLHIAPRQSLRLGSIVCRSEHDNTAAIQKTRCFRKPKPGIDNGANRLPFRGNSAYGKARVIAQYGAYACQYHATARAPVMTVIACFLPGNPLRLAV